MHAELPVSTFCYEFSSRKCLKNSFEWHDTSAFQFHKNSYIFAMTRCSWFWNRSAYFTRQRRLHSHASFLWIQQETCHFSTIFLPVVQDIFLKLLTLRFSRTFKRFYSSNLFRVKNLGGIYSTWIGPQLRNGKGVPQRTQNRNNACSFYLLQQNWLRKPS